MTQSQIVLYTTPDGEIKIDTVLQNETIWLTQAAMAELFGVNVPAIPKHLTNIYDEGELTRQATISKMETVQNEGGRQVARSNPEAPNMGLAWWQGSLVRKQYVAVAKNYLNAAEIKDLNEVVNWKGSNKNCGSIREYDLYQ